MTHFHPLLSTANLLKFYCTRPNLQTLSNNWLKTAEHENLLDFNFKRSWVSDNLTCKQLPSCNKLFSIKCQLICYTAYVILEQHVRKYNTLKCSFTLKSSYKQEISNKPCLLSFQIPLPPPPPPPPPTHTHTHTFSDTVPPMINFIYLK